MATSYKVLAQSNPSATTLTTLYTVPGSTSTTVSSIVVCNTAASATTFRVSIQVGGAGDATKQYLYRDLPIAANDTFIATIGITLAATDVLAVYAGNGNLAFSAFGVELT